jgi:hypothetical protein
LTQNVLPAYDAFSRAWEGCLAAPRLRPVEAPHHARRQYLLLLIDG